MIIQNSNKEWYEERINYYKKIIEKYPFFNCTIMKGREYGELLHWQMNYAKSLGKPFYVIMEEGADRAILNGALVFGIFPYKRGANEKELEKSVEEASNLMVEQVKNDFPEVERMAKMQNQKVNGIARLLSE